MDTETGEKRAFSPEGVNLHSGGVSPDGKLVAAFAPDRRVTLYSPDGGEPKAALGVEPEEVVVRWTADGRGLYLMRFGAMSLVVSRLDLATGHREQVHAFAPPDAAGVLSVGPVLLSADGKSYVYSYRRILDDLVVVTGVQ